MSANIKVNQLIIVPSGNYFRTILLFYKNFTNICSLVHPAGKEVFNALSGGQPDAQFIFIGLQEGLAPKVKEAIFTLIALFEKYSLT